MKPVQLCLALVYLLSCGIVVQGFALEQTDPKLQEAFRISPADLQKRPFVLAADPSPPDPTPTPCPGGCQPQPNFSSGTCPSPCPPPTPTPCPLAICTPCPGSGGQPQGGICPTPCPPAMCTPCPNTGVQPIAGVCPTPCPAAKCTPCPGGCQPAGGACPDPCPTPPAGCGCSGPNRCGDQSECYMITSSGGCKPALAGFNCDHTVGTCQQRFMTGATIYAQPVSPCPARPTEKVVCTAVYRGSDTCTWIGYKNCFPTCVCSTLHSYIVQDSCR